MNSGVGGKKTVRRGGGGELSSRGVSCAHLLLYSFVCFFVCIVVDAGFSFFGDRRRRAAPGDRAAITPEEF